MKEEKKIKTANKLLKLKRIAILVLPIFIAIIITLIYLYFQLSIFVELLWEFQLGIYIYYIMILFLSIITYVASKRISKRQAKKVMNIVALVHFIILVMTSGIIFIDLWDDIKTIPSNLYLILNLNVSYFALWKVLIIMIIMIMSIVLVASVFKEIKNKKIIIKVFLALLLIPIVGYIVEETYYDFTSNPMQVTMYGFETKVIELFDNEYSFQPEYKVKLVGDDEYYKVDFNEIVDLEKEKFKEYFELEDIANKYYLISYDPNYADVKVTQENEVNKVIDKVNTIDGIKIFQLNQDTTLELKKYGNNNEFFYIYSFSEFIVFNYTDRNKNPSISFDQKELIITFDNTQAYVYTRRKDDVYKYTFEKQEDEYVQVKEYEYVADIRDIATLGDLEILDTTYDVYYYGD